MKEICEIKFPPEVKFSEDHEWISKSAPYRIGISDYAQDALGDLTFAEMPEIGTVLTKGGEFGTLESTKSVSPLLSPINGKVVSINDELNNDPGVANRDPYGDGWIVEVELDDPDQQLGCLMDAADYKKFIEDQSDK